MTLNLDSYNKNGFLILPKFLSNTCINSLIKSLTWLVKAQLAATGADLPISAVSRHQKPIDTLSDLIIYLKELSPERQGFVYDQVNRLPWMHNFASNELLINFARQLLSENIAIHSRLNIVMSPPGEEWHLARWHQDSYYNQSNHLVAYVPLQDATPNNGSLQIAEGNHLDGLLPHDDIRPDNKWIAINKSAVSGFNNVRMLDLKKGDLLLFDGNLPHTATLNNSDCARFAITIRFSNLEDEFFIGRGWIWEDLSIKGANALKSKMQPQRL